MIAMDLARELKVALLPWRPRRGDLCMDRLNIAYLVMVDGSDESGAVVIDTGQGLERRSELGLTWLPRLDQLLAALSRFGPFQLAATAAGEGRRDMVWDIAIQAADAGDRHFRASDAADAAGKALHVLLSEAR